MHEGRECHFRGIFSTNRGVEPLEFLFIMTFLNLLEYNKNQKGNNSR